MQLVYYGVLGATRQHPLQSIMVFDLGGISHFTKQNQFPVTWSASETALLTTGCYQPTQWDIYWRLEPCEFVMHKLERDKAVRHAGHQRGVAARDRQASRSPISSTAPPSCGISSRGENLTMWTDDVYDPSKKVFADRPAFNALVAIA